MRRGIAIPIARLPASLRVVLFAGVGASLALFVAGQVSAPIGPFDTTLAARPGLAGSTTVRLAPLGSIELDTHDAPLNLELRVDELRVDEAERIAADPAVLTSLEDDIASDARSALRTMALRCVLVTIAGGAVAGLVAGGRMRSALIGATTGLILAGSVGAAATATFDSGAVAEPRYSGLMTVAPTAVGNVEGVVTRFGEYRAQLTELVGNVVTLYRAAQGLPTFDPEDNTIRLLHVSDIHLNPQAFDLIDLLVKQFEIDAVADTGDITDWGSEPEARLVERIGDVGVPYVWVRGNHDSAATQAAVAGQRNAVVLDGTAATVAGLRLWGFADTRFTPNKQQPTGREEEKRQAELMAPRLARSLAQSNDPRVDVVLVHDARGATGVAGEVPLVLSGHTHRARVSKLGGTRLLVEGSTGGAGLRGLQADAPEPLTCSVLYFDPDSKRLVALDRVTVRGLGETGARIERHIFEDEDARPSR